jgi:hypothetical protein
MSCDDAEVVLRCGKVTSKITRLRDYELRELTSLSELTSLRVSLPRETAAYATSSRISV